ncbi:hypothetical protein [Roseinatronobacter sp. S2]|uniref:hypothetical protein n=1 Tax=Roseinatronobacter sp. S2 TaxID=3035471 RepID=UPI00240EC99C|nr:hypothetical protein [Roseinatronobacter sp. S2]WFE73413.1 hypothetical protein P8S53_09450 [Roseinatronobacter sp. S2]
MSALYTKYHVYLLPELTDQILVITLTARVCGPWHGALQDLATYAAPDNKQTDALALRRARLALRDQGSGVCEASACAIILLIQRVGAAVACICRPSCLRELLNLLLGNAGQIGHDLGRVVMIEGQCAS